jgi:hypothetical protein
VHHHVAIQDQPFFLQSGNDVRWDLPEKETGACANQFLRVLQQLWVSD